MVSVLQQQQQQQHSEHIYMIRYSSSEEPHSVKPSLPYLPQPFGRALSWSVWKVQFAQVVGPRSKRSFTQQAPAKH
eukprot:EW710387.1.p1 GENE.EW710387.1~~EW710387.1.p1  ORF type:complete len:76 (+),score=3.81 EW710387.1:131-358(+)